MDHISSSDVSKSDVKELPIVVVHWPCLGPYHVARLEAAAHEFLQQGYRIKAIETFGREDEYLWRRVDEVSSFERYRLFPDAASGEISRGLVLKQMWACLDTIYPVAVAINGYSSWDAICILFWCYRKHRLPILMSDSKLDDAPRIIVKEIVKKKVISQYGSALCAGTPQKDYLVHLGMKSEKIFDGYDVINNHFFVEQTDRIRQGSRGFYILAGSQDDRPFFLASGRFIPRKNFLGLIEAYDLYRGMCGPNHRVPWRLVILGDGPQREELIREINSKQLQFDVTLAGAHTFDALPTYYGLARAFIHPPLQDQWGLVVNEAMASALPVLVSARAGCAIDLIADGVEGFVFNHEDRIELAELMLKLSFLNIDLPKMGQAARKKIMLWGVERFAKNLLKAVLAGLDQKQ